MYVYQKCLKGFKMHGVSQLHIVILKIIKIFWKTSMFIDLILIWYNSDLFRWPLYSLKNVHVDIKSL